jgi:2-polyprenyl-3-methyl-5-hydroxy-6-metoxy-1,4-benzoquinol methylase
MIDLDAQMPSRRREILREVDAETVKKIRILGYYIDGLGIDEICAKLNVPESMVSHFLQQFSVSGIEALNSKNTVPPQYYTRDYYLGACGGHEEFLDSEGKELCPRLQRILDLVDIEPGMRVLDVGCGRGELVLHAALKGAWAVGIDYSENAVEIAGELRASQPDEIKHKMSFQLANA